MYSSLIRIVAQVGILPVAVALPSLQRRLEVSLCYILLERSSLACETVVYLATNY
jgi:hypothetical protein